MKMLNDWNQMASIIAHHAVGNIEVARVTWQGVEEVAAKASAAAVVDQDDIVTAHHVQWPRHIVGGIRGAVRATMGVQDHWQPLDRGGIADEDIFKRELCVGDWH